NDVDLFLIRVDDPATFTCSVVGGAAYDTQLWQFEVDGRGIAFRDDDTATLQSTLSGQFLTHPGHVLVGISAYDMDACDAAGQELWADQPFATERAPDGAGSGAVSQWLGNVGPSNGPYSLFLGGATFADPQATTFPFAAWALVRPGDFPGQASFTPRSSFQHQPNGRPVTVNRLTTGQFEVQFPTQVPDDGAFQAFAVNGNHAAVLNGWGQFGNNLVCFVNVFDNGGTPVDRDFAIQYRLRSQPTDRAAYVWADQPTAAQYTPDTIYSWNGNRPDPTITRFSTGVYRVRLPGLGQGFTGGTFSASPYTFNGVQSFVRAKVDSWGVPSGSTDLDVFVRCFGVTGVEADSLFVVTYHTEPGPTAPSDGSGSYLWADQPTTASYTPAAGYRRSNGPAGPLNTQTVTRTGTGVYEVVLPSVRSADCALATAVARNDSNKFAAVASWSAQGAGTRVVVHTFAANGTPADSEFLLNFITDDPAAGTATNAVIGTNCSGVVLSGQSPPALNTNWSLGLSGLPVTSHLDFMLIGLTNPNFEPNPVGTPGCVLHTDAAVLTALMGSTTFSLFIPNDPQFIGVPVFAQSLLFVPGANPLGIVSSNGVRGTVGN
ncbi:MAG: hypothetical protein AB7O84_19855, partial [Planctomycetota bacterium]